MEYTLSFYKNKNSASSRQKKVQLSSPSSLPNNINLKRQWLLLINYNNETWWYSIPKSFKRRQKRYCLNFFIRKTALSYLGWNFQIQLRKDNGEAKLHLNLKNKAKLHDLHTWSEKKSPPPHSRAGPERTSRATVRWGSRVKEPGITGRNRSLKDSAVSSV